MISAIISRLVILVFGTLYPAYASYKAVRTKNLKEYVKWMMYWIVFALFTCTETFTDMFLSWFPFYYEVKIVLVLWLLSPATKGSSFLYRNFVHPALCRREQEIDEYIAKAKDQGYHTVLNLGTKGVNYATTVIMQTAIKNLNLPYAEQGGRPRKALERRDVTDYRENEHEHDSYNELEYAGSGDTHLPGIVEIVESDSGDADELAHASDDASSARSRGHVLRKRKGAKEPRANSRGRTTRSQSVLDKQEVKGGGGIVQQIRKSYSLSDLSECDPHNERSADEADDVMTEPRAPRQVKGRYNTRRSASESSRSMYFPEMDLDVRNNRCSRSDEPDFSHIKSSEDISSGYSSADNSASLARTASVGAGAASAAAPRTRHAPRAARTTVTTIKRPTAAEGNEVIIEELQEDDTFEYSNMPALVNVQSQLYLSHTDPPFLYQYVGDQVRIIQVLGENPLVNNNNSTINTDCYDQSEATFEDASATIDLDSEHKNKTELPENNEQNKEAFTKPIKEIVQYIKDNVEPIETQHKSDSTNIKHNEQNTDVSQTPTKHVQDTENLNKVDEVTQQALDEHSLIKDTKLCVISRSNKEKSPDENLTDKENVKTLEQDAIPITPIVIEPQEEVKSDDPTQSRDDKISSDNNTTANENSYKEYTEISRKVVKDTDDPVETETTSMEGSDSGDSDDEASFGTPEESPKSKRKSPKGKYGKGKAPPPPPTLEQIEQAAETIMEIKGNENKDNKSDGKDNILNAPQPNTISNDPSHKSFPINPITEKKTRLKSKSPARMSKGSSSGIGKLLHLPGKLAFWNKNDESKKSKDSISTADDQSRRSSTIDKSTDEFNDSTVKTVSNYESSKAEDVQSIADDAISFQDATDFDSEVISHELMEKSDALQRLIEAKLESHPEYKLVPLHGEIPTSSKSTDV